MKITIFNANDKHTPDQLNDYVEEITNLLQETHEVGKIFLCELDINYCNGCWGCWVKTPGKCVQHDDMENILDLYINSDLAIFAAPMEMGFPSALMKKANDRLLPLVHPYLSMVNNECHHLARYSAYPVLGLILEEEPGGQDTDLDLVDEIYKRTALNLKTELKFTSTIKKPAKELYYEINNL